MAIETLEEALARIAELEDELKKVKREWGRSIFDLMAVPPPLPTQHIPPSWRTGNRSGEV